MSWITRLSNLLRPRNLERELDAEIEFHLQARSQDNMAGGMSELEARRDAARRFGNRTLLREDTREANRIRFLDVASQDLRYAVRGFRRNPRFTLIAVVSLALGIGANAALFSIVNTLLLKALPYKDADHLVYVSEYWPHEPVVPGPPSPDFANWRTNSKLVEGIAAYGGGADALNLIGWGEPERIRGTMTTSGFLDLIGVRMALGRDFTKDEDRAGGPPAAILGYRLWQRKFGGSPDVLGKIVQLGGIGRTVVGVLPSGFAFPDNNFPGELLVPIALGDSSWHDERGFRLMRVVARVKPGVSPAALRSEFAGIVRATAAQEPPQMVTMRKDMEVRVTPLRDWLTGGVRRMVLMLEAVVAMLLLIACLNVASLQVARAAFRRKEMALRAAIGAGRGRLIRQLLTESLLLGVLGGGLGLALGYLSLGPLRAFLPVNLHLADNVHMDGAVLLFTLCIAIFIGILSGVAPALGTSRPELQEAIKQGRTNPSRQRLQGVLVIAEIAIATVLLVGCGLFVRTFVRLAYADPGFRPEGVLTLRISLPEAKYADSPHWSAFFSQLLDRAQAIPGVESAAIAGGLPLVGTRSRSGTWFEGRPDPPPGARPAIPTMEASPAYFHAMGIPILRGRAFNESDNAGTPVAIVNQAFAEHFFPGEDAMGKRIQVASRTVWREIVGIAGNVRQEGRGALDRFLVYEPPSQFSESEALLILKSSQVPPDRLVSSAAAAVHQIDPNQPVFDVATMEERLGVSLAVQRANMTLVSVFATLALILAAIGIFAITAFFVSQRTHELGIRFALGATRSKVLKMILGRGMCLTATGLILGIVASLAATRAIRSLLEGIQPNDPVAFSAAAVLFGIVAGAACLIPAVRAFRVDPMVTLRHD